MKKLSSHGYCYNCGNDNYATQEVEAYLLDENGQPVEDGPTYKYIEAYCPKCDSEIYVEKIKHENILRKRKADREYFNLVPEEYLFKLPKKYKLPRSVINIVLDFQGELALEDGVVGISMWDGELPSSEESDKIRKAVESPTYFLEQFEKAKDKLPDGVYKMPTGKPTPSG